MRLNKWGQQTRLWVNTTRYAVDTPTGKEFKTQHMAAFHRAMAQQAVLLHLSVPFVAAHYGSTASPAGAPPGNSSHPPAARAARWCGSGAARRQSRCRACCRGSMRRLSCRALSLMGRARATREANELDGKVEPRRQGEEQRSTLLLHSLTPLLASDPIH